MQVPTPGAAVRQQTPFAMTDTSYSQPGTSDISANTQVSDSSWQQRPSIQGMALQVGIWDVAAQHCGAFSLSVQLQPQLLNTMLFCLQTVS